MSSKIKRIYGLLYRFLIEERLKVQAISLKKQIQISRPVLDTRGSSIFILIPHADDEWIGNSQIICSSSNVVFVNMDMNGGDSQELHKERERELRRLSNHCSTGYMSFQGFKESYFTSLTEPFYIGVPNFFDWHPEHLEVMSRLKHLLDEYNNPNARILLYQVSIPMPSDFITHVMPLNKREWNNKWKTFKDVYKTQNHLIFKRFAFVDYINGAYSNHFASEVYHECDCSKWLAMYDIFSVPCSLRDKLKESLLSLNSLFSASNRLYNYLSQK